MRSLSQVKNKQEQVSFIDCIDVRPEDFSFNDYKLCLKGLVDAIWEVNTKVFKSMKDSTGFIKAVLLVRPDIFAKLNIHNQANKIRDNSVFLDWRTTYENYRKSPLFEVSNRLLGYNNEEGTAETWWDSYFPWKIDAPYKKNSDDSFINCLRLSLSRPRDIISIMKAIQDSAKKKDEKLTSSIDDFIGNDTQNAISDYYISEARDWCLYRFSGEEFETLLYFFQFLDGKSTFSYDIFLKCYDKYFHQVDIRRMGIFDELMNPNDLLQLLYELNMICYIEVDKYGEEYSRFCYREREIYNLSPQVKLEVFYRVHYALHKALNLGRNTVCSF